MMGLSSSEDSMIVAKVDFDMTPGCDGRPDGPTDRQTDGQTDGIANTALCIASYADEL